MSTNLPHSGEHELDEVLRPARGLAEALRSGQQVIRAVQARNARLRDEENTATTTTTRTDTQAARAARDLDRAERDATLTAARTTWKMMEREDVWANVDDEARANAVVLAAAWSNESQEARDALETFTERIRNEYEPEAVETLETIVTQMQDEAREERRSEPDGRDVQDVLNTIGDEELYADRLETVAEDAERNPDAQLVPDGRGGYEEIQHAGGDDQAPSARDEDSPAPELAHEAAGAAAMRADDLRQELDHVPPPNLSDDAREAVYGVTTTRTRTLADALGAARKSQGFPTAGAAAQPERTRDHDRSL